MRLPLLSAGFSLLLGSGFILASDDAPISALAALTPSAALAQAADQTPPGDKAEQKPAGNEQSQAAPEHRPRRHRARLERGHRPERAGFRGRGPMIARLAEQWGRLPDDMKITLTKSGKEPAELTVAQGDKTWTVKDTNLQDLPPEVRGAVGRFLGFGLLSRLHGSVPGRPQRAEADRRSGGDHRETRRHAGRRHHGRHHWQGRGRGGDRDWRDARQFRFGDRRHAGVRHRGDGFRGSPAGRFAHHRRGDGWRRPSESSFRHMHRHVAMRQFHSPRSPQAAVGGPAFGSLGGRLEQLVSRLERLVGPSFPSPSVNRPAPGSPGNSWRPPMAGWFGGNRPSAEEPRRPAGDDNTAELREQIERLQQQQERMAHALRDLSEALSRTRRD